MESVREQKTYRTQGIIKTCIIWEKMSIYLLRKIKMLYDRNQIQVAKKISPWSSFTSQFKFFLYKSLLPLCQSFSAIKKINFFPIFYIHIVSVDNIYMLINYEILENYYYIFFHSPWVLQIQQQIKSKYTSSYNNLVVLYIWEDCLKNRVLNWWGLGDE